MMTQKQIHKESEVEDDRYEEYSLREEQELLERIDWHIINQTEEN